MNPRTWCALWMGMAAGGLASGAAFGHGDLHERIVAQSRQIAATPHDATLYQQRAELHRQHEDWQQALKDCEQAKQLDPSMELELLRGRTLLEAARPQDALPALNQFLSRHPTHPQALVCRARAHNQLRRPAAAIADYRQALQSATTPEPDWVQETAKLLASQGTMMEALQVLDAAITKLGALPALELLAIEMEITTQNFDGALGRIEVLRHSTPRPEPWMAKRAAVLAQAGRLPESHAAWQSLLDHLRAQPPMERGSTAMSQLMVTAQQALASLDSYAKPLNPPSTP